MFGNFNNILNLDNYINQQNVINPELPPTSTPEDNKIINYSGIIKESPDSLAEHINGRDNIGAFIYILDSNQSIKYLTNKFYLTSMQISFKERVQLLDTFDGENISFFGNSVKVYFFTGVALDYFSTDPNKNYLHQSGLIEFYNNRLRGTLLVKNKEIAVLKVLNHLIYGYPLDFAVSYDANFDKAAQFRTSWVILEHKLNFPVLNMIDNIESVILLNTNINSTIINYINLFLDKIDNYLKFVNWDKTVYDFFYSNFKIENLYDLTLYDLNNLKDYSYNIFSSFKNNFEKKFNDFNSFISNDIKNSYSLLYDILSNQLSSIEYFNFTDMCVNDKFNNQFNSYIAHILKLKENLFLLKLKYL